MSDFWRLCEGQVIDNKFRLRRLLGSTDDTAVFLTQLATPQSEKAVIKFITAGPTADNQISLWLRIMQLSHPNLLRLFDVGRCRIENRDRLFVVMEYADEDLSQILPLRVLAPAEARDMLEPVLDALVYLHAQGLVHSRIKPSNILATADQLKLSSDSLLPIGESRRSSSRFDAHDAPETAAAPLSPAVDVWSLGMTLVETLTQRPLALQPGSQADPAVPDTLPQPLLDVARHALRRDPRRRWTISEIAARLNPVAAAAAAGHSASPRNASPANFSPQNVSPLAVPLSPVPAVPAAKLPIPKLDTPPARPQAKAQPQPPRPQAATAPKQGLVLPNYVVPAAAVLLIIVAIIALPKILARKSDSSSAATTAAAPVAAPPKLTEQPVRREVPPAAKPAPTSTPKDSLKNAAEKKPVAPPQSAPVTTTPAAMRTDTVPPASAPSSSASSSAGSSSRGEVLDQVLPDASPGALATIHGVVRVSVRVKVDPTGNVSEASLDSPGPSSYFADLALKAARRWQFNSPEASGHSIPSEWVIRFHFTPTGAKAIPTQTAP
ncbi:MAG TPA: TonB family protein [Candidatus Acidoferrum sp.]|nr:TonB family protein [Candidatus Acidoferrum sp.]